MTFDLSDVLNLNVLAENGQSFLQQYYLCMPLLCALLNGEERLYGNVKCSKKFNRINSIGIIIDIRPLKFKS